MGISKGCKVTLLLMVFIAISMPNIQPSYALNESVNAQIESEQISVKDKFAPGFWEKIQELKANGTTGNVSLIIRLVRDQWKRRQKFVIRDKDQWMRVKETIEKLIPNLR